MESGRVLTPRRLSRKASTRPLCFWPRLSLPGGSHYDKQSMKRSHPVSSPCPTSEDELRLALEKAGRRFTRQRAAVFAYLRAVETHPTAEQVFAGVRQMIPRLSLATVYKSLEALVDAGLAARLASEDGTARYDGRSDAHYHLRCLETGQVRDLPLPYDPLLLERLAPQLVEWLRQEGFEMMGHRIELVGRFVEERYAASGKTETR